MTITITLDPADSDKINRAYELRDRVIDFFMAQNDFELTSHDGAVELVFDTRDYLSRDVIDHSSEPYCLHTNIA